MALAGLGFAVACLAVNAAPRPNPSPKTQPLLSGPPPTPTLLPQPGDRSEPVRASHFHFNMPWWLVQDVLALLLGVGALLAVLLIVRLMPRLERRRRVSPVEEPVVYAPAGPERLARQVSHALDDTLAAFRRGDRERAIIACWIRLEQIAEEAGFARLGSETSSELAERWLARLPVSRQPLLDLAELYREARYSSHRLAESALVTARSALEQLRREISSFAVRSTP